MSLISFLIVVQKTHHPVSQCSHLLTLSPTNYIYIEQKYTAEKMLCGFTANVVFQCGKSYVPIKITERRWMDGSTKDMTLTLETRVRVLSSNSWFSFSCDGSLS